MYNETKAELDALKIELAVANSKLESKDEVIKAKDDAMAAIKDRPVTVQVTGTPVTEQVQDSAERPKMEQAFIDPTESKKGMLSHLKFNDVHIAEQEVMSSKVSKLKSLLGELPNK
jgi:hypothetical protein